MLDFVQRLPPKYLSAVGKDKVSAFSRKLMAGALAKARRLQLYFTKKNGQEAMNVLILVIRTEA